MPPILGSGNFTGVVFAAVYIGDRGNGVEAWWRWDKANNADFTDYDSVIGTFGGGSPPTITKNTDYWLQIVYDENKTFTFTIADGNGANPVDEVVVGPDRVAASAVTTPAGLSTGTDFKDGGDGSAAIVSAKFDDALVVWNSGASMFSDSFAGNAINSSNWRDDTVEAIPNLVESKLWMTVQAETPGAKRRYTSTASLADTTQNCVYAETEWDGSSTIPAPTDDRGRLRLATYLYNDTHNGTSAPYNGSDGNIFAQVRIESTESGALIAKGGVFREPVGSPNDTGFTFSTVPVADQSYPMFIEHDKPGKKVLFHFDGETIVYDIVTPVFDVAPGTEFKAIQLRIEDRNTGDGSDAEGFLFAEIDNVFSGETCLPEDDFLLLLVPTVIGKVGQ